jgi:DNA adenine methylase
MMATRAATALARPIVKWAGGKTRLLPELIRRVPKRYGSYIEPFVGGGALFFALANRPWVGGPRDLIGDTNPDLMDMYMSIRGDVSRVRRMLGALQDQHWKRPGKTYLAAKKEWNEDDGPLGGERLARRAALFIYLNRTCYNGLWRVNRDGLFNVPMGRYTKPRICDVDTLVAASRALSHVRLRYARFEDSLSEARPGDFVYCDPPYAPSSKTAFFRSYTRDGFDEKDHAELAVMARGLIKRGVMVMLSNSDTPLIRELYRNRVFRVERVFAPRPINSKGSRRGKVAELIITGGYGRHW